MITRDPFCKSWKRTERVINEAARRGFELVVALDERSCDDCKARDPLDQFIRFTPERDSCDPMLNAVVQAAKADMVLLVSDDEEPSPALWDFAQRPPFKGSYVVRLVTPVGAQVYEPGFEMQMRLLHRPGWKWVGGIDGHDDAKRPASVPFILWHYATAAPRAVREAKLANYMTLGADLNFGKRHLWEGHPEGLRPMTEYERKQFPR